MANPTLAIAERRVMRARLRQGVELGDLNQDSVPHMPPYRSDDMASPCPNSQIASQQAINLPEYAGLRDAARERHAFVAA